MRFSPFFVKNIALFALALAWLGCATSDAPVKSQKKPHTNTMALSQEGIAKTVQIEEAIERGREMVRQGETEEAVSMLNAAISVGARGPEVYYLLAVAQLRSGNVDGARENAMTAYKLAETQPYVAAIHVYVNAAVIADDAADAIDALEDIVGEDPDNLSIANELLRLHVYRQDYAKVLRDARELLKRNEAHAGVMLTMARAYLGMKRYELAGYVLQRALELSPEDGVALVLMSQVVHAQGEWRTAMGYLERAVKAEPSMLSARVSLGVVYQHFGDSVAAKEQMSAAIRLAPNRPDVRVNFGNACRGMKEYEEAQSAYQEALKIEPKSADAHYNLGILYLESPVVGMTEEERLLKAIDLFQRYRELEASRVSREDPVDKYIAEAYKLLELAKGRRDEGERRPEDDDDWSDDDWSDDEKTDGGERAKKEADDDDGWGDDDWGDGEETDAAVESEKKTDVPAETKEDTAPPAPESKTGDDVEEDDDWDDEDESDVPAEMGGKKDKGSNDSPSSSIETEEDKGDAEDVKSDNDSKASEAEKIIPATKKAADKDDDGTSSEAKESETPESKGPDGEETEWDDE
jgi:tetratricopeptide (TPR) repeat protein